jgi:hydroxypyruvate isomerase
MKNVSRRAFIQSGTVAVVGAGLSSGALAADSKSSEELKTIGKTPHTKFAVNVEMWWRNLDFIQRIENTAALGFPAIEFWDYAGKDLDKIKDTCDELGLAITQFTAWGFRPGMNNPKNHDLLEEKIKQACKVAKKLGCKLATVVGGDDQPGMTQKEMHANIIKALKRVAPIAEDGGLTLILESMNIRVDHKGHCLYGSEPAVRICREVGSSHVKINWDLYHMQISEGDLCGHLREGFDQLGYLQLADHPGRREPGTGEIHYPRVLREAYELGYRGYVGLECRPSGDPVEAAKRVALADQW